MTSLLPFSRDGVRPGFRFLAATCTAVLLAVTALAPTTAQGQFWSQEAEIIVPNEPDGIVRAFIDSLGARFDRSPDAIVQRRAGGEMMTYRALSDRLLDDGVDIRSASHAFVSYAFSHTAVGVTESIRSVTLIYRTPSLDEEDIALIHLRADSPEMGEVLFRSGQRNRVNLGAITPFRDGLVYPRLSQVAGAQMVRYAGEELREGFVVERDQLLALLTEFIYNEGETFVMRLE